MLPVKRDGHPPLKELTPLAERAAVMDAWGTSRKQIAEELGVALGTVSGWRNDPLYRERRREELEQVMEDAKMRLQRDRQGAFASREEARAKLTEMLDATDPDGHPLLGVQQMAAKILLEDKAATSEFDKGASVQVDARIAVGAVFHVHEDGKVVEETIEVEAEEVEE